MIILVSMRWEKNTHENILQNFDTLQYIKFSPIDIHLSVQKNTSEEQSVCPFMSQRSLASIIIDNAIQCNTLNSLKVLDNWQ